MHRFNDPGDVIIEVDKKYLRGNNIGLLDNVPSTYLGELENRKTFLESCVKRDNNQKEASNYIWLELNLIFLSQAKVNFFLLV